MPLDDTCELLPIEQLPSLPHEAERALALFNAKEKFLKRNLTFQGFPITIENEIDSYREWPGGRTLMQCPYGFIRGTEANDGEEIDCYLGPFEAEAEYVYVIRQLDPERSGLYDEDKCFLGFLSVDQATECYLDHREDNQDSLGRIETYTLEQFRELLKRPLLKSTFDPDLHPKDEKGRWSSGGGGEGQSSTKLGVASGSIAQARQSSWKAFDSNKRRIEDEAEIQACRSAVERAAQSKDKEPETARALARLTPNEFAATQFYQQPGAWRTLSDLRKASPSAQSMAEGKEIYKALSQLREYSGTTSRGLGFAESQQAQAYTSQFQEGKELTLTTFMSSSKDSEIGRLYSEENQETGAKWPNQVVVEIEGKSGRSLEELSAGPMREVREVVHLPGSRFKVERNLRYPLRSGEKKETAIPRWWIKLKEI